MEDTREAHPDVSRQMMAIARDLDRLCREPGVYNLSLIVDETFAPNWLVLMGSHDIGRRYLVNPQGQLTQLLPEQRARRARRRIAARKKYLRKQEE